MLQLHKASRALYRLCNRRRVLLLAFFALLFTVAGVGAFWLRFEFTIPQRRWMDLAFGVPVWAVCQLIAMAYFRVDRIAWSHASIGEGRRTAAAVISGSLVSWAVISVLGPEGFPRSTYVLDCLLSLSFCSAFLLTWRSFKEFPGIRPARRTTGARTVIYGAGCAGAALLRELQRDPACGYYVCGFADDDPSLKGAYIHGVEVLGQGEALAEILRQQRVTELLLAIPSASAADMSRIVKNCASLGARFRTVPSLPEIISGRALSQQLRDISLDDLLGRVPVVLAEDEIYESIREKTILVTGAAGSIGSELCNQLARFGPARIVGLDTAETALFQLEIELRERFPHLVFSPEIGSIQNTSRLSEVFAQYRPSSVFHAAAYKHVPLLEAHIFEAIENNVIGTANVALIAGEYGVSNFVMISTDKAVHPTSMLGATKRYAELLINSLDYGNAKYVAVRFGNVLGSNGSVVPIFKRQIAMGGPLTVTHPEMRRYFMTIPEAARLVLQASTMGSGGEIFILDMGQQVKIVDLARRLICLSGLRPELDIRIEFSGMRPGEKLYEELTGADELVLPTTHEKVKVFAGKSVTSDDMLQAYARLVRAVLSRDVNEALKELRCVVKDYEPGEILLRNLQGVRAANLLIARERSVRPEGSRTLDKVIAAN